MKLQAGYNKLIIPVITLLFCGSVTISYFQIRRVLQNELDESLRRTQKRIETFIRENGRAPEISSFSDQVVTFDHIDNKDTSTVIKTSTIYIVEQKKEHLSRELRFPVTIKDTVQLCTIKQPLEGTKHLTRLILKIAVFSILVILLMFWLVNKYVLTRIWKPFHQSLKSIREYKVYNNTVPEFPETKIDEFRLMNSYFRQSADGASAEYRKLKEFNENAAHEIQTPLAVIRSQLDLLSQEITSERQSELLQPVNASLIKLSKIQTGLLLLSKIENNQFVDSAPVELKPLFQERILGLQEIWTEKNIRYTTDLDDVVLSMNADLLEVLLNNLFSNITRHTPPDGQIYVKLAEKTIEMNNTGNGTALDETRIFERFYSTKIHSGGSGLGLSIVKKICEFTHLTIQYRFQNEFHCFHISW